MLVGCNNKIKRTFGVLRTPPDEFEVVSRAPLSVPPDMTLREPRPGAASLSDQIFAEQAQAAVFGVAPGQATQYANTGGSAGEQSLLGQAGALQTDPNIRARINRETAAIADAEDGFINKLLAFGTGTPNNPNEVIVDAEGETRRLRENRALGRPVTEGETPEVTPPEPRTFVEGVIERVLGGSILGQ